MNIFFRKLRRTILWVFLLVLPLQVPVDPDNPNVVTMGGYVGTGQVLSVLRDCEGNPLSSESSTYEDMAASLQWTHCSGSGPLIVLGLRSGYLSADAVRPIYDYVDGNSSYEDAVTYTYYNPYFALEGKNIGIGFGYLGGEVPMSFGDNDDTIPMSGHVRFGNYYKTNLQIALNEGLPLASGGGYFQMGLGYSLGKRSRLFTGLSAGFYDQIGLVQQVSFPLSEGFELDFSGRYGTADSQTEGGVAVGLRYNIPVH